MKRAAAERLRDILDAAEEIEALRPATQAQYDSDRLAQLGLLKLIEIIGEAAHHVPDDIRAEHPDVPWTEVVGMRNRTVHGYFEVNFDLVWLVAAEEIPKLVPQIQGVLDSLDPERP